MYQGPKTLDSAELPFVSAVIYGKSGVGKTVLACSSQQFRTFVFDVDSGIFSARTFERTIRANVHYETIRSTSQFTEVYSWLKANIGHYQLIVVDTASELQRMVVREFEEIRNKGMIPDQMTWGAVLNWMEWAAREFRSLPVHTLWTAHENETRDEDTQRTARRPNFQGQFGVQYAKHVDLIARYFIHSEPQRDDAGRVIGQQHQRWLQCEPDQMTDAKCRGGGLARYELPDIDHVINKMALAAIQSPQLKEIA